MSRKKGMTAKFRIGEKEFFSENPMQSAILARLEALEALLNEVEIITCTKKSAVERKQATQRLAEKAKKAGLEELSEYAKGLKSLLSKIPEDAQDQVWRHRLVEFGEIPSWARPEILQLAQEFNHLIKKANLLEEKHNYLIKKANLL